MAFVATVTVSCRSTTVHACVTLALCSGDVWPTSMKSHSRLSGHRVLTRRTGFDIACCLFTLFNTSSWPIDESPSPYNIGVQICKGAMAVTWRCTHCAPVALSGNPRAPAASAARMASSAVSMQPAAAARSATPGFRSISDASSPSACSRGPAWT